MVSEQQLDSREWPPNSCQEEIGENSTNGKVGTNPSRHHLDRFRSLENGERTSTKSCGLLEGETVWLQCDVYDTGIGIPGMILASILAIKRQLCIANAIFVDCLILMLQFFLKCNVLMMFIFLNQIKRFRHCSKNICKSVQTMLENMEGQG